jgi:DNA end-binding protein Ku
VISLGRERIPVKLYSAVVDLSVRFHLLHRSDHVRLQQLLIHPGTGESLDRGQVRKGLPTGDGRFVLLQDAEIDELAPAASREIEISGFVPDQAIALEWYDRPYFLGPLPEHEKEYRALAEALAREQRRGIAHWVMRKKRYSAALCSEEGHLLFVTLHSAEEVVPVGDLQAPAGRDLTGEEASLAGKLVDSLAGRFDPREYHDTYREEVRKLVEAKRQGKKPPARKPQKPRRPTRSLADTLRRSVQAVGG